MNASMNICNEAMNEFKASVKGINFVYAHEKDIKNVPMSDYLGAVSVKKVVVGDRLMGKAENDGEVDLKRREICVTVAVNLYTPTSAGAEKGADTFDEMTNALLESKWGDLRGAKLYGTNYSRETQSLVTKTEFEIVNFLIKPETVETI